MNKIINIVLKHLPGQHEQKRHGWRYGSNSAAVRALRRAETAEERSEYRKRAGIELQKIPKVPREQAYPKPAESAASKLESDLRQFSGSEEYHKWSYLFKDQVLTDGAKYLAEKAGAYWLMDAIASHQKLPKLRNESFQVWRLTVTRNKQGSKEATLVADDGNDNVLARQRIPFTDFPLDKIKLYLVDNIIMLPNEY